MARASKKTIPSALTPRDQRRASLLAPRWRMARATLRASNGTVPEAGANWRRARAAFNASRAKPKKRADQRCLAEAEEEASKADKLPGAAGILAARRAERSASASAGRSISWQAAAAAVGWESDGASSTSHAQPCVIREQTMETMNAPKWAHSQRAAWARCELAEDKGDAQRLHGFRTFASPEASPHKRRSEDQGLAHENWLRTRAMLNATTAFNAVCLLAIQMTSDGHELPSAASPKRKKKRSKEDKLPGRRAFTLLVAPSDLHPPVLASTSWQAAAAAVGWEPDGASSTSHAQPCAIRELSLMNAPKWAHGQQCSVGPMRIGGGRELRSTHPCQCQAHGIAKETS